MKQDVIIQIRVLDKESKCELLPNSETEVSADISNLNGVINHIQHIIKGMIDVDKSKMIGAPVSDE